MKFNKELLGCGETPVLSVVNQLVSDYFIRRLKENPTSDIVLVVKELDSSLLKECIKFFDYAMKGREYKDLEEWEKELISEPIWNEIMISDSTPAPSLDYSEVYEEIVGKLVKYIQNNNLKCMVLGVSGGLDSTVCAAICHEVEKRTDIPSIGISLPIVNKEEERDSASLTLKGWYSPENTHTINLFGLYKVAFETLRRCAGNSEETKIANGNIMARLRMLTLYNMAGINGGLVIDTDNLTEYHLGFFTIHGDQGDYAPIEGLWKTEVYNLAKWILSNKAQTTEQKKSLEIAISITPTDGNGVSKSDLEQIGGKSYEEVDYVLRNHILGECNDLSNIPLEVQEKILDRNKKSAFKRKKI